MMIIAYDCDSCQTLLHTSIWAAEWTAGLVAYLEQETLGWTGHVTETKNYVDCQYIAMKYTTYHLSNYWRCL